MDTPPPETHRPDAEAERAARLFAEGLATPGGGGGRRPPAPEEVAPLFPNLEVLDVIGVGGMGVVYRARQPRLDRLVALKVLWRDLAEDPAFAERFQREARALAHLDHPNIVRVYDFGETDGLYWLLLEHVDGANLRQVMSGGRLAPQEALAIVPRICEALQYAHDHGVVHRDIKPENVLIDESGGVKIADFGLAKLARTGPADATLTGTGQVMGTWQYMAPEQYRSPQDVDHRADIFSLGVVFYEMLTGELPVGRFAEPSASAALDRRIDAIVMKTLERERERRYQHASDVRTAIQSVGEEDDDLAAEAEREGRRDHRAPNPLWLLLRAGLTGPVGFVLLVGLAATQYVTMPVVTGLLFAVWILAVIFSAMAIHHLDGGARVAAILILLANLFVLPLLFAATWMMGRTAEPAPPENARSEGSPWATGRLPFAPGQGPAPLHGPLGDLPLPEVVGAELEGEAMQVLAGVTGTLETWKALVKDGTLDLEEARQVYPREFVDALEGMTADERAALAAEGGLGFGFDHARGIQGTPPARLRVRGIHMDTVRRPGREGDREARIAIGSMLQADGPTVDAWMVRTGEPPRWVFAPPDLAIGQTPPR